MKIIGTIVSCNLSFKTNESFEKISMDNAKNNIANKQVKSLENLAKKVIVNNITDRYNAYKLAVPFYLQNSKYYLHYRK